MTDTRLKNCPFCGGTEIIRRGLIEMGAEERQP